MMLLIAVGKKTNKDPMDIFNKALENIKPALEVKSTPCWWI
jgi:ribosomal protein S7